MSVQKVIIAHPGKQHVFQFVTALKQEEVLYKFITTVYDKEDSFTGKLKKILKGDSNKKASSRKTSVLDDNEVVLFNEIGGLFLILLGRLNVSKKISSYFFDLVQRGFARKVAKYALKENVDAVIMFDSCVHNAFDIIKKKNPDIKCILDVTIASRPFMKDIYLNDMEVTGDDKLKTEQVFLWDDYRIKNYRNEFIVSDYLLVGSEFVKNSILPIIGGEKKIVKIPYGVDVAQFKMSEKNFTDGPLKLFFVGGVNRRKGMHHLLSIVSKYTKEQVTLSIAGGYDPASDLYLNYKDYDNIKFEGFVTRDVVSDYYSKSHVFVLPSLAEGLALVGLEALASGVPVLCTENTGVNDIVKDGENGFIVPASNTEAFKAKIDWFLANRDKIKPMGEKAVESAQNYTWAQYHLNIANFIKSI